MTQGNAAAPRAANDDKIVLSQEELDRLSSDSEGGSARRATGFIGWLTALTAFGISIYALYWTQFSINTTTYRASFLALCMALIFILYPMVKMKPGQPVETRLPTWEEIGMALVSILLIAYLVWSQGIYPGGTPRNQSSFAMGLALVISVCFALYPLAIMNRAFAKSQVIDWIFAVVTLYTAVYLTLYIEEFKTRAMRPSADELVLGLTLIILILEATRRTVGWILPAISVVFLAYGYYGSGWLIPDALEHRGFSLSRIIGQNFLTLEGIFTTPIDVAATFIILFTIYGAVLDRGGAGRFFIDWSFALFGKNPGRPRPAGRSSLRASCSARCRARASPPRSRSHRWPGRCCARPAIPRTSRAACSPPPASGRRCRRRPSARPPSSSPNSSTSSTCRSSSSR